MSDQAARNALMRMNHHELFVHHQYTGLASDLQLMAATDPEAAREKFLSNTRHELCEAYGFTRREQSKPFAFANGIAIIPVHGSLINRFGGYYGSVTGYNFIRSQFYSAMADDEVKAIVFDHNSYGGEAAGCFELSAEIFEARGTKPLVAMVDSNCYSASFALASAADKIYAIPSAGVGSIGVVAMHVDMSKLMDNWGIAITFIHSGEHKVDGNPYQALSKEVKADIQKGVDKSRAKFVSLVAQNLGMDEKVVYDTEARTYRADEAKEIGLVHAIAVPRAALQSLIDGDDSGKSDDDAISTTTKEHDMADEQKEGAKVVDQAAIQKAERERISGIMNCEEAKGRSKLANHLAMNTSMSVDDAKAVLANGAIEAAAAAPEAKKPEDQKKDETASRDSSFEKAMGTEGGTGVKPNEEGKGGDGKENAAARILANYGAATGQKFGDKK